MDIAVHRTWAPANAGPTARRGQGGIFRALPPVRFDGTAVFANVDLPENLPRPLPIVSAYFQLHTGVHPILDLCGLFNVFISRTQGAINLVAGMNRHGAVRWTHDPPIMLQEGEVITASYGGQIPPDRLEKLGIALRLLRRREPFAPLVQPDVQITWRE